MKEASVDILRAMLSIPAHPLPAASAAAASAGTVKTMFTSDKISLPLEQIITASLSDSNPTENDESGSDLLGRITHTKQIIIDMLISNLLTKFNVNSVNV